MVVPRCIGHAKTDGDFIQKQLTPAHLTPAHLTCGAQVVTRAEHQLIRARRQLWPFQQGGIGAAIGIGDSFGNLAVALAAYTVKHDPDTACGPP